MSPRTPTQNEAKREQSKKILLDAAFALFAKNGYEKTSIAQIAKAAGVSKGLVYNYFSSKEELLNAIFLGMVEQFSGLFDFDFSQNPKQILKTMLDETFKYIESGNEVSRLIFQLVLQKDAMDSVRPTIKTIIEGKLKSMEKVFEAIGYAHPATETLFIGAFLDGVSFGYLTYGNDYPLKAMQKKIYEYLKINET